MEHDNHDDEQSTRQQLVGIGRNDDGDDERDGNRRKGRKVVGSLLRELGQIHLTINPIAIGSMTTQRMLSNMPTTSTSTLFPANAHVSNGVRNGASKVDTPVMPTESARSPLAR